MFQLYPENAEQIELITASAMTCGFTGGLVVDYPNSSKAKKYFLVLFAGQSNAPLPAALGTGESGESGNTIRNVDRCATSLSVQSNAIFINFNPR